MAQAALKLGQRATLDAVNFKGVRDLSDPYAVPPQYLSRARNIYLPEPGAGCGAYARPGWKLNNADPYGDISTGRTGNGMVTATIEDGTEINFIIVGGRLFRLGPNFTNAVDVTPAAPIAMNGAERIYATPFSNRLVITDGMNTPWVASNLQATPVTGTLIDYLLDGSPWRAYGPAVVFDDALVFIVRYRGNQARTSRIAWSLTDDPFTGYFQPNFDFEWDLIQNGTSPIYGLYASNYALWYFREDSIGYASGTIGADFKTTAQHDAIDRSTGLRAPATIVPFGDDVYFADQESKPQLIAGSKLEDPALWLQMRRVVTPAPTRWADLNERTACAALVPELDLYIVALWTEDPTKVETQYPTTLHAFHAPTGRYVGDWRIADGIAVHSIGTLVTDDGQKVLAVLGSKAAPVGPQALGDGGYLWILASLEDGLWKDNGQVPEIYARGSALGYSHNTMLTVDRVVAVIEQLQTDDSPIAIDLDPS